MNSWPTIGDYPPPPPPPTSGIFPNRTRVIIIYPTVDPHVVVVPIVSSIFVFPIIVFLIICWLRKMAAKRRQRARLAHRDDFWNERSCASIVQRSPPLSVSIGNGYSGVGRHGLDADVDIVDIVDIGDLVPSTLDVEMLVGTGNRGYHNNNHHNHVTTTTTTNRQLSSPNNNVEVGGIVSGVYPPADPTHSADPDPDLDLDLKLGEASSISSS